MPIPSYFQPIVKAPKRTVQSDLAEGIKKEDDLLPLLWEHFNDKSIVKVTDKFSPYDFESLDKGTKFELKSRNNSSATYDTTMVGASKVRCASSLDHKFYFIFGFTNCIKYIRYRKEKFDKYDTKFMGRDDRGRSERNMYVLIPVSDLKTF
jgi:hypothetical protein